MSVVYLRSNKTKLTLDSADVNMTCMAMTMNQPRIQKQQKPERRRLKMCSLRKPRNVLNLDERNQCYQLNPDVDRAVIAATERSAVLLQSD